METKRKPLSKYAYLKSNWLISHRATNHQLLLVQEQNVKQFCHTLTKKQRETSSNMPIWKAIGLFPIIQWIISVSARKNAKNLHYTLTKEGCNCKIVLIVVCLLFFVVLHCVHFNFTWVQWLIVDCVATTRLRWFIVSLLSSQ